MTAPLRNIPVAGEVIATVRSYPELVEAFRMMKARLGLSNKWCDDACDYADGRIDKMLGPSQERPIDPLAFSMFCEIFGLEFEARISMAAIRRMEARWEQRVEGKVAPPDSVMSRKLIKKAKPIVFKETGKLGGMVTAHLRTPVQRSEAARKAANSRWKKARRGKRNGQGKADAA